MQLRYNLHTTRDAFVAGGTPSIYETSPANSDSELSMPFLESANTLNITYLQQRQPGR